MQNHIKNERRFYVFCDIQLTQFWIWEQASCKYFQIVELWDEVEFGNFEIFFAIDCDDIAFSSCNYGCICCKIKNNRVINARALNTLWLNNLCFAHFMPKTTLTCGNIEITL